MKPLIIDSFAGGGGASTGIFTALVSAICQILVEHRETA